MDWSKDWPDNVLTTKAHIMALYPPFHTSLIVYEEGSDGIIFETKTQGTILHYLIFSNLSKEMIVWMIEYYKECLVVYNHSGFNVLEETIDHAWWNNNAFLIRLLLKYTPPFHRKNMFDNFRWGPKEPDQTIDIMHALLDYSTDADVCAMLDSLGPDWDYEQGFPEWLTGLLNARRQCKIVAAIIQRRRLISRNKDVSWLVSRYILATRMEEAWIRQ